MNYIYTQWLPLVIAVASRASDAILGIYQRQAYQIKSKADRSPVTKADLLAHEVILEGLTLIDRSIPVLSEEDSGIDYSIRSSWKRYWLVDPLDGTKEFIKGTGEFTVNIALIDNGIPVLGVVMVPTRQHCYWAIQGGHAYFQDMSQPAKAERIRTNNQVIFPIKVAMSRHSSPELGPWQSILKRLPSVEWVYCGSALKICLVAKGDVDLYPRLGPTCEWDTAAGQCILEAAGGKLVDIQGQPLKYNTRASVINPTFIAVSCVELLAYVVDNS